MSLVHIKSAGEQVAERLHEEILSGQRSGQMAGIHQLAAEFGVNHKTVEAALRQLEKEHLLVPQGPGRRRRIVLPAAKVRPHPLRVAILTNEAADRRVDYIVDLRHKLEEAGHAAFYAEKSQQNLGMNLQRIAKMVERTEADAWVVVAGSREVLEWFVVQEKPAFALFGRRRHLRMAGAGPDKVAAFREVVRHLVALGHRRIVMLSMSARRLPEPGLPERAFLEELKSQGISVGPYHLPDWEESPEGLQKLLDELFKTTPPTALVIDEAHLFHAVKHHLAGKGIRIPDDLSLVCSDPDRNFEWCRPTIAHIRWDSGPVVRRVVRWAANMSRGHEDRRQTQHKAAFIKGGTVGPALGISTVDQPSYQKTQFLKKAVPTK